MLFIISLTGKNRLLIMFLLLLIIILLVFFINLYYSEYLPSNTSEMIFRIVVDAGHGSIDTGTSYRNIYEKDINLAVAKYLSTELKRYNIIPIMTRTEDKLYQNSRNEDIRYRPRVADEYSADLFISIHTNNYPSSQPAGSQIFYKSNSGESKKLAESIQLKLITIREENNRVIKSGDYYVLNKINCPGVIIELGFLSNPSDRQLLIDKDYQQQLAKAIAKGIVNYLQSGFGKQNSVESILVNSLSKEENQRGNIDRTLTNIETGPYLYYIDLNEQQIFLIKTDTCTVTGNISTSTHPEANLKFILEIIEELTIPPAGLISPISSISFINSLKVEKDILTIDFSAEFSQQFNGGAEMETAIINAITKSLVSLPGINGIKFTIEGEKESSIGGHIILNQIYR
ncbi:MAG TPA: N-acetylmuramoyl-L-alanine amidase [Halanaerobiales bacterium]|nr:N-acetylmuramoyl-L-alanine amidase [Halanaerobiales bacterium]